MATYVIAIAAVLLRPAYRHSDGMGFFPAQRIPAGANAMMIDMVPGRYGDGGGPRQRVHNRARDAGAASRHARDFTRAHRWRLPHGGDVTPLAASSGVAIAVEQSAGLALQIPPRLH